MICASYMRKEIDNRQIQSYNVAVLPLDYSTARREIHEEPTDFQIFAVALTLAR
jgi:hypothetical protein